MPESFYSALTMEPDQLYRLGRADPKGVFAKHLENIQRREPDIKAFSALNIEGGAEAAARSARRWNSGVPLSSIDGLVVGIKDVFETADMPTGQGSPIWDGFHTKRDAAAVQALREAGAIIIGKTTTTEFATSYTFADTRNPHDTNRTPGGSSSGSAAGVAAGMMGGGLATQVVGSIIRPSSYCGVVGYKPSYGALNRGGSYDHFSQSCIGTIGSSIGIVWGMARAIVRSVGGDPGCKALSGPERLPEAHMPKTLGILRTAGWANVGEQTRIAFKSKIEKLLKQGVEIIDCQSDAEFAQFESDIADAWPLTLRILAWEAAWPLRSYPIDKLSPVMQKRRQEGLSMTIDDYERCIEKREFLRESYDKLFAKVDAMIALSAPGCAPIMSDSTGDAAMNVPASLLGVPTISLPVLRDSGLPLGLQLIGQFGRDVDLMAIARWYIESLETYDDLHKRVIVD